MTLRLKETIENNNCFLILTTELEREDAKLEPF